ncbi:O-antigen ligase family protein [Microbulbifer bruguierae]|uniref:O-antigen ligase family protein n=1 Tax=Microbulbifer bruguierae TaxID=3029061 RepID=A0ABY8NAP5_9GAMM|nr:O-antigen ligase family protein [Microbulbifer bruguierae]WGL15991.1 O-antigen ligase family protein [Microbulbifer bruguierae]
MSHSSEARNSTVTAASARAENLVQLAAFFWQPNRFIATHRWLQITGALALLVYGFFGISVDSLPDKAAQLANLCGLILLAFCARPVDGVSLRHSGILWLAVAAIGVSLISWIGSWVMHPQWAESSFKVHRLTNWFAMIPLAVLLGGQVRNVYLLWGLALLGLLISPWVSGGGWREWQQGFAGVRVDFGLHNAQHTAMLFGTATLGLLAFAPAILRRRRWAWPLRLGWLLALATSVCAVILTQTRGVWVGMLPALLISACAATVALHRHFRSHRRYVIAASAATCGAAALVGYLSLGDVVSHRLAYEQNTIALAQQGELAQLPYTSTGIRLHTWAEAMHWIGKHPLVGWGGNGRSLIFDHSSNLPDDIKQHFGHLHNSYLDLMVNFGLLGLLLLAALVYWLMNRCLRYYRAGLLSGNNLVFCLSFTVFFGVINFFESYLFYDSGRLLMALIGGGLLTQFWAAKRQLAAKSHPTDIAS